MFLMCCDLSFRDIRISSLAYRGSDLRVRPIKSFFIHLRRISFSDNSLVVEFCSARWLRKLGSPPSCFELGWPGELYAPYFHSVSMATIATQRVCSRDPIGSFVSLPIEPKSTPFATRQGNSIIIMSVFDWIRTLSMQLWGSSEFSWPKSSPMKNQRESESSVCLKQIYAIKANE